MKRYSSRWFVGILAETDAEVVLLELLHKQLSEHDPISKYETGNILLLGQPRLQSGIKSFPDAKRYKASLILER